MVENILISIIVPVYRVEPYIVDCMSSIIRQRYRHLQVIIINDNTDDRSVELCRSVVKSDARFFFVNLDRNVGVGTARNIAMFYAKGEFLYFLDSDDRLYDNAIQELVDKITDNVDIVEAGCTILKDGVYEDNWNIVSPFDEINMYSCHLYRRRFLIDNGVFFPEWRVAQDQVFLLKARASNPNVVHTDLKSFYYCRFSKRFNRNRYTTALAKEHVRAETEMIGVLLEKGDSLLQSAFSESVRRMCVNIESMLDYMDLIELVELDYSVLELLNGLRRLEPDHSWENALDNVAELHKVTRTVMDRFRG